MQATLMYRGQRKKPLNESRGLEGNNRRIRRQNYQSLYRISDRRITVRTPFGSKTAHIGGHTPEQFARTLFHELVGKENA